MKRILFLTIFTFALTFSPPSVAQEKVTYTITAEAHALMCPFLSPKLMDLLTKKGAEAIYKDEQLALHFFTSKTGEMSDELILKLVEEIGYETRMFTILRSYE
jgi:hypothetical protein